MTLRSLLRWTAPVALAVSLVSCSRQAKVDPKIAAEEAGRKPAPEFALKDVNGATVKLSDYRGKVVLLKLSVESSSISSSASGVAGDPITNKNTINTSVLIGDGGTLVLGGLIQDSVTNNQQSIPLLGNIPLLGELFRTRNNQKTKTDFLIFLQPHIMRDDEEAAIETNAKYNYLRGEQRKIMRDSTLLPLAPYQPAEPLPPLTNGAVPPMFGAGAPVSATPPLAPATAPHPQSPPPGGGSTP